MKASYVSAMLVSFFCLTEAGHACLGVTPPNSDTIRAVENVALVRVVSGRYISQQDRSWRANATVITMVEGSIAAQTVPLQRGLCEGGPILPDDGDFWVVYLDQNEDDLSVHESLPLSQAADIDHRVAEWRWLQIFDFFRWGN